MDDTVSDVTQPEDSSQRSEDTSQQPEDTSQEPDDTSQQSEETPQHSEDTHRQPPDTLQQSRRPDAMRDVFGGCEREGSCQPRTSELGPGEK